MAKSRNDILFRFIGDTKSLDKATSGARRDFKKTEGRASALTQAVGAVGLAFGAQHLGRQVGEAISAASDFNESVNAVEVSTGDAAAEIMRMGDQAAQSLGLSKTEVNEAAVAFAAFGEKIDAQDLGGVFEDYATRATDFASVMNLEVNDAMRIFQSGLAGESEPLRKFGLDLSAASVQAFAVANGISEVGKQMSEAEKVQARYGLLMEDTEKFAGDFANTSDDLANSQRRLNAEYDNAQILLGEKLVPAMLLATEAGLAGLQFVEDAPRAWQVWQTELENVAHALSFGVVDAAEDADGHLAAFNKTVFEAGDRLKKGKDPIRIFADWVSTLGETGDATTENIKLMTSALGLNEDELRDAIRFTQRNAEALGLTDLAYQNLLDTLNTLTPELSSADRRILAMATSAGKYATKLGDMDQAMLDSLDIFELIRLRQSEGLDELRAKWNSAEGRVRAYYSAIREGIDADIAKRTGGVDPGTGKFIEFHSGGTVPGSRGSLVPAMLQGGEHVSTPSQMSHKGGGGVTINVEFSGVIGDPAAAAEQILDLLENNTRWNGTATS